MSTIKKTALFGCYFILIFIVLKFNSEVIVDWLNKSLFVDFSMDEEFRVNDSFYNGASFVVLIFLIIYAIFGTFLVSVLVTNLLFGTIIFANQVKVKERNEFITFKELQAIASPKELLSFIDVTVGMALFVIVSIISLLALLHFISKKLSKKLGLEIGLKYRVVILLTAVLLFSAILVQPAAYNQYVMKYEEEKTHNFNPVLRAKRNGFIPTFLQTVKPEYMVKPSDYGKEKIELINEKYTGISELINQQRDKELSNSQTIYYLSETLIDPMALPGLLENGTPTPFFSELRDQHSSGKMYSQYIGGGTANIEWSVLTSFSLEVFNDPMAVTPYSDFYVQSKNHHTVLDYFKNEKVALHPYTPHLYKRQSVYAAIGFDDFLYLDNGIEHTGKLGTHKRVSDEEFHKDILRVSRNENVGMIHALSMQNHSPYTGEIPDMDYIPKINYDVFPEKESKGLTNYLQGLRASDEAFEDLIGTLSESDQEINLILYGDHFPSLFRGKEQQFPGALLHETPWLIYMNHGRSEGGLKLNGISPIFLTTVLLKEGNYKVTPFQALMDQMLSNGVKRIARDFIVTDLGVVLNSEIDEDLLALVNDYRTVMYDALFGSDWLPGSFYDFHN
ncbi:LTA synthase family protein [Bhargavaea massiliensis]|uniref:LTA synthase family protein n=1 Tax=Bhargavaea massiliensis TaxID=2697500 RepID=UPI001BCE2055|nr:alkaline phosphatase family protein [Bhargavaea massiliensis]